MGCVAEVAEPRVSPCHRPVGPVLRRIGLWALSRPSAHIRACCCACSTSAGQRINDNTNVTLLPEPIFVRLADEPDPKWTSIEEQVQQEQQKQPQLMKEWCDRYQLEFVKSTMEPTIRLWKHEGKMVFPPNDELKQDLLHLIHNKPTAAHVGQDWTIYTTK